MVGKDVLLNEKKRNPKQNPVTDAKIRGAKGGCNLSREEPALFEEEREEGGGCNNLVHLPERWGANLSLLRKTCTRTRLSNATIYHGRKERRG